MICSLDEMNKGQEMNELNLLFGHNYGELQWTFDLTIIYFLFYFQSTWPGGYTSSRCQYNA